MKSEEFIRTELLYGTESMKKLASARVIVFGVGGVGGYAVEALARSGVGSIDVVDNDVVDITNINRQIIATHDTIGQLKVDVIRRRIHSINPDCKVHTYTDFILSSNEDEIVFSRYDYVVDAIDTVSGKLHIIERAKAAGVDVICAMGAGNKISPFGFVLADIYDTKEDPLARVIRRECKKRGIKELCVLYSEDKSIKVDADVPGSVAFVPSVAGLMIASKVVNDICGRTF